MDHLKVVFKYHQRRNYHDMKGLGHVYFQRENILLIM